MYVEWILCQYVVERIGFVSLFSLLFATFSAQICISKESAKPELCSTARIHCGDQLVFVCFHIPIGMDSTAQIDFLYVVERIGFVSLFSLLFATFSAQICISRKSAKTPEARAVLSRKNAKAVNRLCGALASLWAALSYVDLHGVFAFGEMMVLYKVAFTAGWSFLANAFFVNASIAIRAMITSGNPDHPHINQEGACYKVWFKGGLLIPWACAILSAVATWYLDRRYVWLCNTTHSQ